MVKFGNRNYRALLDTGAHATLIDINVYNALKNKVPLNKCKVNLSAAEGSPLKVLGYIKYKIKIGQEPIEYPFIVVSGLNRNIILGRDFIYKNRINFYSDLKQIKIKGSYVPLSNDNEINNITRLAASITLKPNTSYLLNMRTNKRFQNEKNTPLIFTPTEQGFLTSLPDVHVAQAVVSYDKLLPVRISNMSNHKIRLRKGCVLGRVENTNKDICFIAEELPPSDKEKFRERIY